MHAKSSTASALIAACHSKACAPPPAGRGGSDSGGAGSTGGSGRGTYKVVQKSTPLKGTPKMSQPDAPHSAIRVRGNRPDGRYETRYIGEKLRHPEVVKAKKAAMGKGEARYVRFEGRSPVTSKRKAVVSKDEPAGQHLRIDANGKVHQVLPKIVRVGQRSTPQKDAPVTAPNRAMQNA